MSLCVAARVQVRCRLAPMNDVGTLALKELGFKTPTCVYVKPCSPVDSVVFEDSITQAELELLLLIALPQPVWSTSLAILASQERLTTDLGRLSCMLRASNGKTAPKIHNRNSETTGCAARHFHSITPQPLDSHIQHLRAYLAVYAWSRASTRLEAFIRSAHNPSVARS